MPEAGAPTDAGDPDAAGPTSNCGDSATALAGASWSVAASRFAFGGTPTQQTDGATVRWIGTDGEAADLGLGYVQASLNAGATAGNLPDWSTDADAMKAHVEAYLLGFGIPSCQVGNIDVLAESGGGGGVSSSGSITFQSHLTIELERVVDGIALPDSKAWAMMNNLDQSTGEALFWPTISATVVTAAKAFRDQLADPTALAAYKAKLPAAAQGDGVVHIRHTMGARPSTTFRADVAWDTEIGESPVSFDTNGVPYPVNTW